MHDCAVVFLHYKRSVLQWALVTDQTEVHYGAALCECFSISKCAYLRKSFSPFTPLFAPQAPVQYLPYHPFGFEWHFNGWPAFPPPRHPTSVVCVPRRNTLEIHFQVNMLWLAANLQPTGVVTAVPDNSQNKLLPRSGMFTVTTDIFASFIWKERDPVISFTQLSHKLNLLALFYFSR